MNVGANLRRIREAAGLSQIELADKVGVSRPLISQIERGTKAPSLPLSIEIAAALGCTLADLAAGA